MPTANERAAEGPRPTPPEIEPGDVVTLKTDGRPYVVLGSVWSMPALYLVRNVEGSYATELTVRRVEIATVRRPAPLLVLHDANPPADAAADPADWLDAEGIDPADVDADADPLAGLWAALLTAAPMEFANPITHAHDPATSAEAAALVTASGTRSRQAEAVLALVKAAPGSTAIELVASQTGPLALDDYQIRRRLTDLESAGRVRKGDARPCRVRGSRMVTWFPVA